VLASSALSNDVPVSAANESNGRPSSPEGREGVLANLPRTRPQRSTPRRAAAREAAKGSDRAGARRQLGAPAKRVKAGAVAPEPAVTPKARAAQKPAAARKPAATATPTPASSATERVPKLRVAATPQPAKPRHTSKPRARTHTLREAVPPQGYESDGDRDARGAVQPPGGAEFAAMLGEIAKAGLSTGERLVRDVLSRLPLN
jgi:hypothetical protein